MRIVTPLALASLVLASSNLSAQPPAAPARPPCSPNDSNFVCTGTQTGPEDLVAISNGKWVIASAMSGSGGLAAVSSNDHRVTKIYPAANAKQARDDRLYKDCPGPPNPEKFTTHGLWLFPAGGPGRAGARGRPRRARSDRDVQRRHPRRRAAGHLGRLRDRARADRPELGARLSRRRLHHDQLLAARRERGCSARR